MLLPFDTKEAANERNKFEAFKRGCQPPTIFWWSYPIEVNSTWYLNVGDGDGLTQEEIDRCVYELPNGAFYRRTDQLDENGNYYLEVSDSITLTDGTIVDSSNYQLGDGIDGWHWYADGETVTIASPSTWEKIKNFFNIG